MTFKQIPATDFSPRFKANHTIFKLTSKQEEISYLKISGGVFLDVNLEKLNNTQSRKVEKTKVIAIINPNPSFTMEVMDARLNCWVSKSNGIAFTKAKPITRKSVEIKSLHEDGIRYLRVKIDKDGKEYQLEMLLLVMTKVGSLEKQPFKAILDTQVDQNLTDCPITCSVCPTSFSQSKLWLESYDDSSFPQTSDGLELPSTFCVYLLNCGISSTLSIDNCTDCSITKMVLNSLTNEGLNSKMNKYKVSLSPTCTHSITMTLTSDNNETKLGPFKYQPQYIHSIRYGSSVEVEEIIQKQGAKRSQEFNNEQPPLKKTHLDELHSFENAPTPVQVLRSTSQQQQVLQPRILPYASSPSLHSPTMVLSSSSRDNTELIVSPHRRSIMLPTLYHSPVPRPLTPTVRQVPMPMPVSPARTQVTVVEESSNELDHWTKENFDKCCSYSIEQVKVLLYLLANNLLELYHSLRKPPSYVNSSGVFLMFLRMNQNLHSLLSRILLNSSSANNQERNERVTLCLDYFNLFEETVSEIGMKHIESEDYETKIYVSFILRLHDMLTSKREFKTINEKGLTEILAKSEDTLKKLE